MTALATGLLAISIDLEPRTPEGRGSACDGLSRRLITGVAEAGLPATWIVSEPATSLVAERIAATGDQEIALLADASWLGLKVNRSAFHRALESRLETARAKGISISTL